jgi:hypothetical protein
LPGITAATAAANLTGEPGTGFFVPEHRPGERISVRMTNFARIRRVWRLGRDVVVPNVAKALTAGIEQAALVRWTAVAAATMLITIRATADITQPRRPIEPAAGRITNLTDVVLVDRVWRNRIAIDLATAVLTCPVLAALALWTAGAATADPVISVGAARVAIVQHRPIPPVAAGVADLASVGRVDRVLQHRFGRDHAPTRLAIPERVAALSRRATIPGTAEPIIEQTAIDIVWSR